MPVVLTCDGCGMELSPKVDRVHPQKHENYCDRCNKVFGSYEIARRPILDKVDELRVKWLKDLKAEKFGKWNAATGQVEYPGQDKGTAPAAKKGEPKKLEPEGAITAIDDSPAKPEVHRGLKRGSEPLTRENKIRLEASGG